MNGAVARQIPPLPAGAAVAPRYEVLSHLCRTGWLDLYDAWSEERQCRCVVKVVRPDRRHESRLRERLVREGRWLQEFTHPHLVRAYETVESPEPYVVLETLAGETLSHLIHRRRRRLATGDLALLGLHICSAVHYLHGRGLLHLDVKPSNIVVDCRRAKVLDLSIARPPGPAPPGIGTVPYLAPEQARGATLTSATDVWGIGITLYEAAAGSRPFDGSGVSHATSGSGSGEPGGSPRCENPSGRSRYPQVEAPAPPVETRRRLPQPLAAAIDRCLAPAPYARPTLRELTTVLDGLLAVGQRVRSLSADGHGQSAQAG